MKRLILIIYALFYLIQELTAQVEFIRRDELRKVNRFGITHITDKENNTYLLSTESPFYNENGMVCSSGAISAPYTLYKIDPTGQIVWQSKYPEYIAGARQILDQDSCIVIIYDATGWSVSKSGIEGAASIPYYALISKRNGAVIRKVSLCYYCTLNDQGHPYYFDVPDVIVFKVAMHKDNTMSCIQALNGKPGKKMNYNAPDDQNLRAFESFDFADDSRFTKKITGPQGDELSLYDDIVHDEEDDRYVIADSGRLSVYDRSWILQQRILLPGADTLHYPNYKISYNRKYYVVNHSKGPDHDKQPHFTWVITKQGRVISTKESPPYEVSGINKHNIIYAVVKTDNADTTEHPVHLISMNIKQMHKKEQHIGPAYTRVSSLSFTNNNELVLTGTCMTTGSQRLPKTPNGIYYYQAPLTK